MGAVKSKEWMAMARSTAPMPGKGSPTIDGAGEAVLALYKAGAAEFPMNRVPEDIVKIGEALTTAMQNVESAANAFCAAVAAAIASRDGDEPSDECDEDMADDIAARSTHRPLR